MKTEIWNQLSELFMAYGLGELIGEIIPVSGGLMHKMYKVSTASGVYAVKCLNPEIMKRPGVLDNYAKAEELERRLENNNLPMIPAICFGTKKMIESNGKYYYIFRWQERSITDFNTITAGQCHMAGEILGRIHGIEPHSTEYEDPEISDIDFKAYLQMSKDINSSITDILKDNLPILEEAQDKLNLARTSLPSMNAIDNPDMDPKNIMWHEGKAFVIDLECLGRGNPVSTCLDLALQWSGTVNAKYRRENLEAFYRGYLSAYDNGFRAYDKLYGIAYTWVEWLEYNIRRALGMEGNNEYEISLGEEEVKNTVRRICYLNEIEEDVLSVLKNLPAPAFAERNSED